MRLGDVGGVDVAVGGVEERALQILGAHQRPAVADLGRGQQLVGDADGLGGRGVELVLVHPRVGLRHAQVADHREAGVEAGLGLERLVELHRVVVDVAGGVAHVEERQQARGVPGRAGGQLVALEEHGVGPAGLGQRVGDPGADRAAADHHRAHMASSSAASLPIVARLSSGARRRRKAAGPTLGAPIATRGAGGTLPTRRGRREPNAGERRCPTHLPAIRRRRTGKESDMRTAGTARGRGADARRLRRHAADRAADHLGRHGPGRPARGRQPRGGRLLAEPERRPRDGDRRRSSSAASTRRASRSTSTSTRSR